MSHDEEELSLADLDGTVRTITTLWRELSHGQRSGVKAMSRDLNDALWQLLHFVDEDGRVNRSPGGTGCGATPEALGYPAERRVADLEKFLDQRHVRENALHHARKLWVLDYTHSDVHTVASEVTALAQAFEQYLTDGTVHEVPVNPNRSDDA